MTNAILTLDGLAPLEGTVETGGDYIRFCTAATLDSGTIDALHEGRIRIGEQDERVMVKTIQPGHAEPGMGGKDAGSLELTLQRFKPSPA